MHRTSRRRRVRVLVVETPRSRTLLPVIKSMLLRGGLEVELHVQSHWEDIPQHAMPFDCIVLYDDVKLEDPACRAFFGRLPEVLQSRVIIIRAADARGGWKGVRTCHLRRKTIRRAVMTFAQLAS